MIIDRINVLLASIQHPPRKNLGTMGYLDENNYWHQTTSTPAHDTLDIIDRHFGIITRFKIDGSLAPVGERVRRLERHKLHNDVPAYFWLGAETENLLVA